MYRLVLLASIFLFTTCTKQDKQAERYFKLDGVGEYLLSGLKLNDTLKFRGSNGAERNYTVHAIQKSKELVRECGWTTGVCKLYYSFDKVSVAFKDVALSQSSNTVVTTSLHVSMTLPPNTDEKNIPADVQVKARVSGNAFILYNALPPPGNFFPYIVYPDFYDNQPLITYTNPVRSYIQVVVIKSGNNNVFQDYANNNYTVNEVWFDKRFGVVFFKDVFGTSWSRIN